MDPLPWILAFGLDSETESSIVLNLLPHVVPSRQLTTSRLTVEKLNATSRLGEINLMLNCYSFALYISLCYCNL